jgi:hypothetical protein
MQEETILFEKIMERNLGEIFRVRITKKGISSVNKLDNAMGLFLQQPHCSIRLISQYVLPPGRNDPCTA